MTTIVVLSILIAAAIACTVIPRRRNVPATRRQLRRAYERQRADLRAVLPHQERQRIAILRSTPPVLTDADIKRVWQESESLHRAYEARTRGMECVP